MISERTVYVNGKMVPWEGATVHMMSHSFSRGSAIFEVLSLHETDDGPAVFRIDEHIDRFFRSAALLHMEMSLSKEDLHRAILETVKINGLRKGMIKAMAYYSQIAFEIIPPQTSLDLAIFAVDPVQDLEGMSFALDQGTTVGVSRWRKLDPQTVPVEAKAAANYLNGMMARIDVRKRGFQDVIMLDSQGFIAEGGTESMFFVKDGRLMTPALGTVLQSITRKSVLRVAADMGIAAEERRFSASFLQEADEIFLSGTPFKVLPVRQVEGRKMAPVPGPVTGRLMERMKDIVSGKIAAYGPWLCPVP